MLGLFISETQTDEGTDVLNCPFVRENLSPAPTGPASDALIKLHKSSLHLD
jgi:hypothetical protein